MKKFGNNWTDFREILYLDILGKSVEEIEVSLKRDNNTYFFPPLPPHVLTDFVVPPPGCGRSITDF
jgi:hypothetical protein